MQWVDVKSSDNLCINWLIMLKFCIKLTNRIRYICSSDCSCIFHTLSNTPHCIGLCRVYTQLRSYGNCQRKIVTILSKTKPINYSNHISNRICRHILSATRRFHWAPLAHYHNNVPPPAPRASTERGAPLKSVKAMQIKSNRIIFQPSTGPNNAAMSSWQTYKHIYPYRRILVYHIHTYTYRCYIAVYSIS